MEDCLGFQTQVASIVEVLANSAVVEICKLVEVSYAALRSQMEQEREKSQRENEALREKLRETEAKMRGFERRLRRSRPREDTDGGHLKLTEDPVSRAPLLSSPPAVAEDRGFPHLLQEDAEEKTEGDGCSLDLKVEVNISTMCDFSSDPSEEADPDLETGPASSTQSPPPPTDSTVDLTCRPRAKRKPVKPSCESLNVTGVQGSVPLSRVFTKGPNNSDWTAENQTDQSAEDKLCHATAAVKQEDPGSDLFNNLDLDLSWMQERVSHLGAAYAVAQLGLGNTNAGRPSHPYPTQVEPDVVTGAHDVASFGSTFDIAAPRPAAALSPGSAVSAAGQRPPFRSSVSFAKKTLICSVCRLVFPSAAALQQHQQAHTEDRPYRCADCGKGFAQANNLRVHLLVHTGERRYHCSLCGKSFISSSHLKRHRTVHTQEKPYSCSRCGQSFSQMCSVRRHRQQSQCGM